MSSGDPNLTRLGAFLLLFILMLFLYASKSVLLDNSDDYEQMTKNAETNAKKTNFGILEVFGMIIDFILFFFGFAFFSIPNMSWYLTVFFIPIYSVMLIAFWYLMIDIIKDFIDSGSSILDAIIPF